MLVTKKTKFSCKKIPSFGTKAYDSQLEHALNNQQNIDRLIKYIPLELGDTRNIYTEDIFEDADWTDSEKIPEHIVELVMDPDYLHFLTKYVLNLDLFPYQLAILRMMWSKSQVIFIGSRGAAKSFLIAVYIILRLLMHQGCRVCVVGAALRQSLVIFNYIVNIFNNAPVLQDICGGKDNRPVRDVNMHYWNVGQSKATFLPLGDGETIRGQRASVIIADEFSSISDEVFETVVKGFAAVKSEGTYSNVHRAYRSRLMKSAGGIERKESRVKNALAGNQIILSGTPSFEFNHFYKKYKYYRAIILTGGKKDRLKELFPDFDIKDDIDSSQYCIIRIPCTHLPPGLMDDDIIAQSRATMDRSIFLMEYAACFTKDSAGFFPMSLLTRATCPIEFPDGKKHTFYPALQAENIPCVMGIDPASESDNFAISIVGMFGTWRGLLYQWTTNRKQFEELIKDKDKQLIDPKIVDYNTFCTRHIRGLMRRFNVKMVIMDAGGGGVALRECLKDPDKFIDGRDQAILDMEDENTELMDGNRILKMINFQKTELRREAHYGLKKDLSDKTLMFPSYDIKEIGLQTLINEVLGKVYDDINDCIFEIEQCKKEMIMIKLDKTSTGIERWDVPNIKGPKTSGEGMVMKKDRFSSVLLANYGARILGFDAEIEALHQKEKPTVAGYKIGQVVDPNEPAYYGVGIKRMQNGKFYTGGNSFYDVNFREKSV